MGGLPRKECRIINTKSSRGVSGLYRTAAETGPISPQEQVWDNEGGAPVASNRKPTISIRETVTRKDVCMQIQVEFSAALKRCCPAV
jgi:hypothetical protein